jgi:hypothetical protein
MSKTLKKHSSLDVFISYRRDGGASVAAFLHKELESRGLRAFMDVKELETGDYVNAIKQNIKASKTFLLVVSEKIFESNSVLLEIKEALAHKVNILPIFINNLETFPKIPEEISILGNVNGIILNHRNFDNTLNEIFTKLTSRKDEILFKITESFTEEDIEYLLDRVMGFDERFASKVLVFTKQYIRELAHDSDLEKSSGIIEDALKTALVSNAKEVAYELGFDHRGSMGKIVNEAKYWLDQGDKYINYSTQDEEQDRYVMLSESLIDFYRSRERLNSIKELFISNQLRPERAKSSADFIGYLMDRYDSVSEVFELLKMSESDMKELIASIFPAPPKGRLKDLTAYLCDWVDYEL